MQNRRRIEMLALTIMALMATTLSAKPYDTSTWVGSNYTPAYCVNAVQLWHDFRPEVIDRELAAAKKYFGITTLRVYLNNIPYDAEKETFLDHIEQFLVICDRHGIKPGFTFFDDCWNHTGVTLESPPFSAITTSPAVVAMSPTPAEFRDACHVIWSPPKSVSGTEPAPGALSWDSSCRNSAPNASIRGHCPGSADRSANSFGSADRSNNWALCSPG